VQLHASVERRASSCAVRQVAQKIIAQLDAASWRRNQDLQSLTLRSCELQVIANLSAV